jgi:L-ascorbate metabolism protein UlaG (beta-lactamase superfamily)
MIKAFQKNEALIADIQSTITKSDGFRVWWLAQSGFLIQYKGKHLLFDPYLTDSLTIKYAQTDKPHTRISELVVQPELLDMIDVVTSSHNHTDHLDADSLKPLFEKNPEINFIFPEANREFVLNRIFPFNPNSFGINVGQSIKIGEFELIAVPAAHNKIDIDDNGNHRFIGLIAKFGQYTVYHSGDTLWYDEMVEILKPYQVDVAFLPINGNKPERKVAGNLNYEEAALLGKEIAAKLTIPHHYDLFEFNTENPANFEIKAIEYQIPFKILRIGEGIEIY